MDYIVERIEKNKMSNWLEKRVDFKQLNTNTIEVITPFLDILNDSIMVYLQRLDDGTFKITDDGFTLWDIELLGFKPNQTTITQLKHTMNLGDLVVDKSELFIIVVKEEDIPRKLFAFASFISTLSNVAPLTRSLKEGL